MALELPTIMELAEALKVTRAVLFEIPQCPPTPVSPESSTPVPVRLLNVNANNNEKFFGKPSLPSLSSMIPARYTMSSSSGQCIATMAGNGTATMSASSMTTAPPIISSVGVQQYIGLELEHRDRFSSAEVQMQPIDSILERPSLLSSSEIRVLELNMRLQQIGTKGEKLCWEHFATEFFTDDAKLIIETTLYDGNQQQYTIRRILIGVFFSTLYEGEGLVNMSFQLKKTQEFIYESYVKLDCCQCNLNTQYDRFGSGNSESVSTDARLTVEFKRGVNETRIMSWKMLIRGHTEFISRELVSTLSCDTKKSSSIAKPLTIRGVPNATLMFLEEFAFKETFAVLSNITNFEQKLHEVHNLMPKENLTKIPLYSPMPRTVSDAGEPSTSCVIAPSGTMSASRKSDMRKPKKTRAKRKNNENKVPDAKKNFNIEPILPFIPSISKYSEETLSQIAEFEKIFSEVKQRNELAEKCNNDLKVIQFSPSPYCMSSTSNGFLDQHSSHLQRTNDIVLLHDITPEDIQNVLDDLGITEDDCDEKKEKIAPLDPPISPEVSIQNFLSNFTC